MKTEPRPLRRKGLKSKLLPDNFLVIVDELSESALTLNPTAAAVWEFCDGEHGIADITHELCDLFSVASGSQQFSSEVVELIAELNTSGLLEFV